jgi:hypothetical protein
MDNSEKDKISTKPLVEWIKYNFNLTLPRIMSMVKSGQYDIQVNGISIRNPNMKIKNDDMVKIGNKTYKVEFKETEQSRKVVQKNGRKRPPKR